MGLFVTPVALRKDSYIKRPPRRSVQPWGSHGSNLSCITSMGLFILQLIKLIYSAVLTNTSSLDPFGIARYVVGCKISLILMFIITLHMGNGFLTKLVT